jgi:hypothetical protein
MVITDIVQSFVPITVLCIVGLSFLVSVSSVLDRGFE